MAYLYVLCISIKYLSVDRIGRNHFLMIRYNGGRRMQGRVLIRVGLWIRPQLSPAAVLTRYREGYARSSMANRRMLWWADLTVR